MRSIKISAVLALFLGSAVAFADLDPWTDYELSDAVWSVTTVRVDANMDDAYLEGLAETWVTTNEVAKKLGQIEEYRSTAATCRRAANSISCSSSSSPTPKPWLPTRHDTMRS